jgi:hypothetical protein
MRVWAGLKPIQDGIQWQLVNIGITPCIAIKGREFIG